LLVLLPRDLAAMALLPLLSRTEKGASKRAIYIYLARFLLSSSIISLCNSDDHRECVLNLIQSFFYYSP
jgi:hypothetical protein